MDFTGEISLPRDELRWLSAACIAVEFHGRSPMTELGRWQASPHQL
jgi:hypothetical protein